ncbi:MAG: MscL family protein [Candidatus Dormibacteria bacterium]
MSGFKTFLLRGNLVQLAVAFVMGVAFSALIGSLVSGLVTPLIAAILGKPNFAGLYFTVNNSRFLYGSVINALITFVAVALILYFAVVVPYQAMANRFAKQPPPSTQKCSECLSDIPVGARRCPFCTVVQPEAS